jgi:hypothetical protein
MRINGSRMLTQLVSFHRHGTLPTGSIDLTETPVAHREINPGKVRCLAEIAVFPERERPPRAAVSPKSDQVF